MKRVREVKAAVRSRELVKDRRERLVKAAISVFQLKGFHTATVREIGAAAQLTQGTIYNYVRSKDDILYLVCDHLVNAYQDSVRQAIERSNDGSSRLEAAISALIEAMYEHQDGILLIYHESHALDHRSLRGLLARVEEFIKFFEGILAEAGIPPSSACASRTLLANIVTFLPAIVALRRWDLNRKLAHDEVVKGLTEFLMKGLGIADEKPEARAPAQ